MFVLSVALGPLNMFVLISDHVSSLATAIVIQLMLSESGRVYVFALACFSWRQQFLHCVDLYAFRVFLCYQVFSILIIRPGFKALEHITGLDPG